MHIPTKTIKCLMRAPGKEFVLKNHSKLRDPRLIRNELITSALVAVMASVSSVPPATARSLHGQTGTDVKQTHHAAGTSNALAWRHNPPQGRGVRDKLLALPSRSYEGSGIASVYSGQHTASGAQMSPGAMTAAHRTLAFGTQVTVVNRGNGRSAVVRINDRGPFVRGRVIDLSPAAARVLKFDGLTTVSLSTKLKAHRSNYSPLCGVVTRV